MKTFVVTPHCIGGAGGVPAGGGGIEPAGAVIPVLDGGGGIVDGCTTNGELVAPENWPTTGT